MRELTNTLDDERGRPRVGVHVKVTLNTVAYLEDGTAVQPTTQTTQSDEDGAWSMEIHENDALFLPGAGVAGGTFYMIDEGGRISKAVVPSGEGALDLRDAVTDTVTVPDQYVTVGTAQTIRGLKTFARSGPPFAIGGGSSGVEVDGLKAEDTARIAGRRVAGTAPGASHVLVWDAPGDQWKPASIPPHNHDSDYISIVGSPTAGNFPTLTAGGELANSSYGAASFAAAGHNHDSDYISIVGSPTAGNFPTLTAGGELANSSYGAASFAAAGHMHVKANITDLETITGTPAGLAVPKADANGRLALGWQLLHQLAFSFTADGDAYFVCADAGGVTLGNASEAGTGTIAYAKNTGSGFEAATLPVSLAQGNILKVSVTGLSGYKAVSLQRTA